MATDGSEKDPTASTPRPDILRSVSVNSSPTMRSSPKLRVTRGGSDKAMRSPETLPSDKTQGFTTCTPSCKGDTCHVGRGAADPDVSSRLHGLEGDAAGSFSLEERDAGELGGFSLHGKSGVLCSPVASASTRLAVKDESLLAGGICVFGNDGPEVLLATKDPQSSFDAELHPEEFDDEEAQKLAPEVSKKRRRRLCLKIIGYSLLGFVGLSCVAAAAVFLGPLVFKKVVLPMMEWEEEHLSKPLLGFVAVLSMAVLPVFMLPTGPSMWLLGIAFDYLWGFCLIMLGAFFGQTLPYAMGHWLMHDRVQAWLSSNARLMAVLRLADSGGWFQQFKTTLFLRMSPFPYPLFNYAITATKIKYGPYICASMVAMIPETFIAIYCGKLIQKLALAHSDPLQRPITPFEVAYELVGLCVAGSVVLVGMVHGHRAFKKLEEQERVQREGQELANAGSKEWEGGRPLGSHKSLSDPVVASRSGQVEKGDFSGLGAEKTNIASLGQVFSGYSRLSAPQPPRDGDADCREGVNPSKSSPDSELGGTCKDGQAHGDLRLDCAERGSSFSVACENLHFGLSIAKKVLTGKDAGHDHPEEKLAILTQ